MADLGDNPIINSLSVALNGLMDRHRAISTNLSNVSTPDYKRLSVSFEEKLAEAQGFQNKKHIPMAKTHGNHIALGHSVEKIKDVKAESHRDFGTNIHSNGNNINIDKEMVELSKTGLQFKAISDLSKRYFGGIGSIINGST